MPEELDIVVDSRTDNPPAAYEQFQVRAKAIGPPSKDQLELIKTHVVDPSILDTNEPYIWSAEVSNQNVDSYFTRMHKSSLKNYAADAIAGLSFMNSHRTGGRSVAELPLGRSFDAKFTDGVNARTDETFYTLKDLNLTGLSTNDFINGMRSGVVRDVSIGFYGGEYRCSICNRDWMNDWDCPHWPGTEYSIKDKDGKDTGEKQLAILWIHDAHQAEVSAVYDGACPGAMISRTQGMLEAGLIKPQMARTLELQYRMKLPVGPALYRGLDINPPSESTMGTKQDERSDPPENEDEETENREPELTEPVVNQDVVSRAVHQGVIDSMDAALKRAGAPEEASVSWMADEILRLRPLADMGTAYRTTLIDEAITEGNRAHGNDFAVESYRGLLNSADITVIKRMRDDWKAVADSNFTAGRQTTDTPSRVPVAAALPSSAYKAR